MQSLDWTASQWSGGGNPCCHLCSGTSYQTRPIVTFFCYVDIDGGFCFLESVLLKLLAIALLLMLFNENHTVQYNIKGPTVSIQCKNELYV